MAVELPKIRSAEDMVELVREYGFLPFFKGAVEGFSVEECCPRELWFSDTAEGPWEWKGPAVRTGECAYGKLYGGKAGFVSREWLPELCNWRRDGYDFDARYEDGLAATKDKNVYDAVAERGRVLSVDLKDELNYRRGGNKGFDTVITRLQSGTYIIISDFVYMRDKKGKPYGWGVAEYSTPETVFGYDSVASAYAREPRESLKLMAEHLGAKLPGAGEREIMKLLKA